MKLAIIITTVILFISYYIKKSISDTISKNPLEVLSDYNAYSTLYSICAIVFFIAIVADIVLVLLHVL